MRASNRLRQRRTNIHNPQQSTPLPLIPERHRIRNHYPTQLTLIQRLDRIAAQYPMSDDRNDFARLVRHDRFRGFDERTTRVRHVVDEDRDLVLDVADQHHARDFVGARALFVDEREAEIEAVGYGCCPLNKYQIPLLSR
jgi:hypothetical protein